jgi:glycosyltransferase involved in cell wall biosynthesis
VSPAASPAPAVSVVISTRDRAHLLARCLDALLSGTALPAEVVVVNQGDRASVEQVLAERHDRGVPLVHVVQSGRGLSRSQNAGVECATSPAVSIVDDDCVPDPRWVEVAAREHASASGPLLVTGRVLPLPAEGERTLALSSRRSTVRVALPPVALPWEVGTGGNFSVTRSAYLQVGGNDERLGTGAPGRAGNDLDLFHRLLDAGTEARFEPELLVLHERATPAEHRSRRWTYGFGIGVCVVLWRRQRDPSAGRLLKAWLRMRLGLLREARRPQAVLNELRVLLGTAHGLWAGRHLAGQPRRARTPQSAAVRKSPLARLRHVRWRYERPLTTAAVLVVGLLGSLLAYALLPDAWRPDSPAWALPAAAGAYVVLRLDAYKGWGKRFKHELMDRFGGDVDDAQTWVVAALAGGGVLVVVALVQRGTGG